MINVSKENLYWLAGLLEGETTFRLSGSSSFVKYPEITLAMSDKDIVYRAASILGGPGVVREVDERDKERLVKTRKLMYCFSVCGDLAIEWMKLLLPIMGERRSNKIRQILELHDKRSVWGEIEGKRASIRAIALSRKISYEEAKMIFWETIHGSSDETKQ